jgi:hypothetical protein
LQDRQSSTTVRSGYIRARKEAREGGAVMAWTSDDLRRHCVGARHFFGVSMGVGSRFVPFRWRGFSLWRARAPPTFVLFHGAMEQLLLFSSKKMQTLISTTANPKYNTTAVKDKLQRDGKSKLKCDHNSSLVADQKGEKPLHLVAAVFLSFGHSVVNGSRAQHGWRKALST